MRSRSRARLQRAFGPRRTELLARRVARQAQFDAGELPDFLAETRAVREGDWTCDPVPADIADRRVEITGPVDRKMIINALNSRRQRVHGGLRGREHAALGQQHPGPAQPARRDPPPHRLRVARRQGVPAERTHRDAVRASARLAPAREARASSTASRSPAASSTSRCTSSTTRRSWSRAAAGPYFYLPKLESHLEARLWNDIFVMAQDDLGIPRGTIKATVLIETILAAFEMDEILYELRASLGGPQRRPLGLHLQLHQEIPQQPRLLPRRSRAGHDDDALS